MNTKELRKKIKNDIANDLKSKLDAELSMAGAIDYVGKVKHNSNIQEVGYEEDNIDKLEFGEIKGKEDGARFFKKALIKLENG